MQQYYYIEFRWHGKCSYDGYFLKRDNDQVIGITDDSIIVGSGSKIVEIKKGEEPIRYEISTGSYANKPIYCVNIDTGENTVSITINPASNMNQEKIYQRICELLEAYPESIQKSFIENYA